MKRQPLQHMTKAVFFLREDEVCHAMLHDDFRARLLEGRALGGFRSEITPGVNVSVDFDLTIRAACCFSHPDGPTRRGADGLGSAPARAGLQQWRRAGSGSRQHPAGMPGPVLHSLVCLPALGSCAAGGDPGDANAAGGGGP